MRGRHAVPWVLSWGRYELPVKIGYDAKWYFSGPASGHIVVRRQAEALGRLRGADTVVALLDRAHRGVELEGDAARLEHAWMWAGNNLVANAFVLGPLADRLGLEVVLCHGFVPLRARCRTVAFIHDVLYLDYPQFYTRVERAYYAPILWLARSAARICTVSETERQRLVRVGVADPSRIDVVYHGVDPSFRPRERHDAAALATVAAHYNLPGRYLLFVGRLNVRKNIETLLAALARIADSALPLVVVGERDWKSSDAPRKAAELGIGSRVRFLGAVGHEALPAIYALAEAFVFPSLAESFGLPLLEAMASGVPCVASNVTCLPEICGDGALTVDPRSPAEIASAIDRVLGDQGFRANLRARGLARAAGFTWERSATALLASLYRAANPAGGS